MKTGTATVRKLMDQVTHGELRLPEIQRGYVWKPAQVAGLIDSLYRGYPSGSILLWETDVAVTEKELKSAASGVSMIKPLYLLDGQQRLTSLHRVFTGHERAQVVFNVLTEKFQIESAATKKDARWVRVHDLLADKVSAFALVRPGAYLRTSRRKALVAGHRFAVPYIAVRGRTRTGAVRVARHG